MRHQGHFSFEQEDKVKDDSKVISLSLSVSGLLLVACGNAVVQTGPAQHNP